MVPITAFAPASLSLLKTGKISAHIKGKRERHRVSLLPLLCTFRAAPSPLPAMPVSNSARCISHRRQRTPTRILNRHLLARSQSGAISRSRNSSSSSSSSSSSLHHQSGERLSTRRSPATASASATTTMAHLPRALIDKVQKFFHQRRRRNFRKFTVQDVANEFNIGAS